MFEVLTKIDLDKIFSEDQWGTTIGDIVKEEIRLEVKKSIKASVKNNTQLKKAIKALENAAAKNILESII